VKRVGVTFRNPDKAIPYEQALRAVGVEPVPITPENPRELDGLDGLIVTGGTDLDPALYGQPRQAETEDPDRPRDELELRLIREALDRDLPLLGICRGCQLLNVLHGGTLVQHLAESETHRVRPGDSSLRGEPVHPVRVEPGTRLASILGAVEHGVNSRHHQAVDRIGPGLVVSARAPDGVIEGLERPDKRFAVGVQWHPEDSATTDRVNIQLFDAFARAVNER